MGRIERSREIARRRTRAKKLKQLRTKYDAASSDTDKAEIAEKIRRVSPFLKLED